MSALSSIIDAAVGSVIAEHPKLFNPQGKERAQKVIVREIVKSLVREPRNEDDEQVNVATVESSVIKTVPATDERAIAYCLLRSIAGAVFPVRCAGDHIYIPPEGDVTAVRALANVPDHKDWPFVTSRQQLTAWLEFFDETLPGISRRKIFEVRDGVSGVEVPWSWPPSKTGKIYDHPPEDEDIPQ